MQTPLPPHNCDGIPFDTQPEHAKPTPPTPPSPSECLSMLLWGERVPSVDTLVEAFGKLVDWRAQYRLDPSNESLRLAIADLESACRSLADSLERQSNVETY
jgi:hypothetical protein